MGSEEKPPLILIDLVNFLLKKRSGDGSVCQSLTLSSFRRSCLQKGTKLEDHLSLGLFTWISSR